MNVIVAIIVGLKRVPECIKIRHFEGEHANFFLWRGWRWRFVTFYIKRLRNIFTYLLTQPLPRAHPHWEGDAPPRRYYLPRPHPRWRLHSSAFGTRPPDPGL